MGLLEIDIALPRRTFEVCAALSVGTETVALIGPSGAGKTSLLRAVAGLDRPRAGRIALGAERWFDAEGGINLSAERRRVGYLPQDYGLFPHLTVADNVRFAARRDRPDLLERLGIGHLASSRPLQLSGGERQRAALARALARDPQLLLLDEPFGALDTLTRRQVRDELSELLARLELPTLLVTHSFEDATLLAKRVGVISEGQLLQLAAPSELLRRPDTAMVAALTGANVLAGTAVPAPGGCVVRLDGGGELHSATHADGRVQIALHPWELELVDPASSMLIDRVRSVRQDRGGVLIRLTRMTVQTEPGANGLQPIAEGEEVGLRAAPSHVRVLPAAP